LALAIIIYGGVSYAASAGNPSRISEAKKWITSAFLGLGLLFGSYLILGFINPNLTRIEDIFLEANTEAKSTGLQLGTGEWGTIGIGTLLTPPNLGAPNSDGYYRMPAMADPPGTYYNTGEYTDKCGQLINIQVIYTVAQRWNALYPDNPLRVGELNGDDHATHSNGLDVDIGDKNCVATSYGGNTHCGGHLDVEKSTILAKLFFDTNSVERILFGDTSNGLDGTYGVPVRNAVNEYIRTNELTGVMSACCGHEDHFHVDIDGAPGPYSRSCNEI
ncbi:pilin, partial [Patescibacteria group bacterium]|nr:pilin [Patescibacteria group bacterium]